MCAFKQPVSVCVVCVWYAFRFGRLSDARSNRSNIVGGGVGADGVLVSSQFCFRALNCLYQTDNYSSVVVRIVFRAHAGAQQCVIDTRSPPAAARTPVPFRPTPTIRPQMIANRATLRDASSANKSKKKCNVVAESFQGCRRDVCGEGICCDRCCMLMRKTFVLCWQLYV